MQKANETFKEIPRINTSRERRESLQPWKIPEIHNKMHIQRAKKNFWKLKIIAKRFGK